MGLRARLPAGFPFKSSAFMRDSMRRRASIKFTEPVETLTFFTEIPKDGKGEIDGESM